MTVPTYLFAGGGSGGHLMPGLAVVEELVRREPAARIVFAGSEREIERRILASHDLEHRPLSVETSAMLQRNPLRFAWRYWCARREAGRILLEVNPQVVIGLGGFASVPVVVAANRRGIPVVLLEQNTVPGRATRWLAKRAAAICTSFDETATMLPSTTRIERTGNPVRRAIAELHDNAAVRSTPTLLVLGGSQGATAVNEAAVESAKRLGTKLDEWRIVHQTGPRDEDRVRAAYEELGLNFVVDSFFEDLVPHYRSASLAIARAGATSLAELACAGIPSVTIPYPGAIHDHQARNAEHYVNAGAAWLVPQSADINATASGIIEVMEPLLGQPVELLAPRRECMKQLATPDAAGRVADVVEGVRWR